MAKPSFNPHDYDSLGNGNLPGVQLDTTLDLNATDGSGHILNGSGNPATHWEVESNGKIQIGSNIHWRTGDQAQPDSVDNQGVLHYTMPAGPQVIDPAHNVSADKPNRGATAFDFSFSTGHNGSTETIEHFLANGGEFHFKIDLDPGKGTNYLDLHAVFDPVHNTGGSHVVWATDSGQILIADDAGTAQVTQNSQNLAFYQSLIDVDPHTPGIQTGGISPAGQYDVQEVVIDNHHEVANIHSQLLLV